MTLFAVILASIVADEPVRIKKRTDRVGEAETTMCKAVIALGVIQRDLALRAFAGRVGRGMNTCT
ncbi:MAG: hypothetical protein OXG71_09880 [Rhodospirillales bacterium]|nr:hypothetical protein [Rhodospirillales bacterium]